MLGKSGAHTQFGPVPHPRPRRRPAAASGRSRDDRGRDEFDVIDALRARFEAAGGHRPGGDLGIGDDAAVVTLPGAGQVVLATDLVVEGVHVDLATSSPEDVGWKALMVAVSDVGAMGCAPTHVLLSVAAPAGFPIERLGDGVAEAAGGCRVRGRRRRPVVGAGPGGVRHRRRADAGRRGRRSAASGARPGDRLLVTGPLGCLGRRPAPAGRPRGGTRRTR